MSFINNSYAALLTSFGDLGLVGVADLTSVLAGNGSAQAIAATNFAKSKITRKVGSTLLRRYYRVLDGESKYSFSKAELEVIAREVNYLTRERRSNVTTSSKNLTTVVTRTVGANLSTQGLEYAMWFTNRPVPGPVTSSFSNSRTVMGVTRPHKGVDMKASMGEPVAAAGSGKVTVARVLSGYGNSVYIDHGNGYITRYGHLSAIKVREGQTVKGGDIIGLAGSTGRSEGPHLHFEVRKGEQELNPMQFLNAYNQIQIKASIGAQAVGNNQKLETSAQVWFEQILAHVQKSGSQDVKTCIKSKADVQRILLIEGGLQGSSVVVNLRRQGSKYCGPFQMDRLAWADGPAAFSPHGVVSEQKLISLCDSYAIGGPGDLNVIAPGIVRFWNNCWKYFLAAAKKKGLAAQALKAPRTVEMLYLMHNQGGAGAVNRLLVLGSNPIPAGQSKLAQEVGATLRAQYRA